MANPFSLPSTRVGAAEVLLLNFGRRDVPQFQFSAANRRGIGPISRKQLCHPAKASQQNSLQSIRIGLLRGRATYH
jgi:hypothetical protein